MVVRPIMTDISEEVGTGACKTNQIYLFLTKNMSNTLPLTG